MPNISNFLEGSIFLVHNRGFSPISFGIRLLTKSEWNHAGLFIKEDDKGYIIEALFRGVVKTPVEKYLNNPKYKFKVVDLKSSSFKNELEWLEAIKTAVSRARVSVGLKYDTWALVWLGIKYIARGVWNKGARYLPEKWNPFQSRYRFFCSELVCIVWHKTSSKFDNLFAGEKYPFAQCDVITPEDINKSKHTKEIYKNYA